MSFEAKYEGWCGGCDGRIHPGDIATYVDDEIAHLDCETGTAPLRPAEVCNQCWLTKPCDCEEA